MNDERSLLDEMELHSAPASPASGLEGLEEEAEQVYDREEPGGRLLCLAHSFVDGTAL